VTPLHPRLALVAAIGIALAVNACAPAGTTSTTPGQADRPAVRKILTLADSYEPKAITETFGEKQTTGNNVKAIVQDGLVYNPQFQSYEPQLAVEAPSIEKGTWKVNVDGTMETSWRLRPNIKWHDGQPFTSDDLVFTFQTSRDAEIATLPSAAARLVRSVDALDPLTFVMHWSGPHVDATRTGVGDIAPRHLLEDMYLKDKQSMANSTLFSTAFVGLGPYRLMKWDQGSFFEATRFDDYYRGRPPLDTIIVRFVIDPNAQVANILSGAVDAVLTGASGTGISVDQAIEVKRRWEGTGNQVLTSQSDSATWAFPQYRPEFARPRDTQSDLRVRKALLHGLDSAALTEVITGGLSPVADSYINPADPRRADMEQFIAKFPYDPTRTQQFLAEAGWNRGADGVYTRASDGERMELDLWVRAGAGDKAAAIIADGWNRLGISTTPYIIPTARRTDRQYEAERPGLLCCVRAGPTFESGDEATIKAINSAATNWQGLNYGAYMNPTADAIVDRLVGTIDPRARLSISQQLVQEYTADIPLLPLWWEVFPMLMLEGVKGPRPNFVLPAANIFEWDRTQ